MCYYLSGQDWSGLVWCGVVWCGVVWRGVAWCGRHTVCVEVDCLSPLAGDLTVQGFEKKKKKILAPYLTGQTWPSTVAYAHCTAGY